VVIVDGTTVVTGSFNLSSSAAEENDENVLIIDSPEVAGKYRAEFDRLWRYYPGDPGQPPSLEAGDDNGD
jgi:phosphatidylserine/phosphatidylglycerophosphate/cardiolipin synthase-like enzyme